jgi:hypothetical protein
MNTSGGVVYMRDIRELEAFDIPPTHIINKRYVFNNKQLIDYEWIEQQLKYIDHLSDRKKHIIRAYTIYGDKFVNNYLRGTLTSDLIDTVLEECKKHNENPFLYQHRDITQHDNIDLDYKKNIIKYIKSFIVELSDIILNSPKLRKQIKVFRGLSDGQFIVDSLQTTIQSNGSRLQYITNNEFISTSIYLASASNFMKGDCCLLELLIEPDVPCLFTAHMSRRRNEYEITLIPGTIMKYRKFTKKYIIDQFESYDNYNVFI